MDKRYGILILSVTIFVLCFVGTASATNWSVDGSGGADFTGIQDAINNAKDGDTILVYSGVYYENVVVDKSVTLKGNGQPVVDAGGRKSAITLTADEITLEGFKATNSGSSWYDAGVEVTSNNNTITGNNASSNRGDGIFLDSSNNNTITGNNASSNRDDGIFLDSSNNNTITGNNASSNHGDGIFLDSSSKNIITGNTVSNNKCWYGTLRSYGIRLDYSSNNNIITGNTFVNDGLYVSTSYQNTVEDNIINGKPLIYLEDTSDIVVTDAGQVILVRCNNITVENLGLSNICSGIELWQTDDSIISNNNVSGNNNANGIFLWSSSNNNITGNIASNNVDGIFISSRSNNNIITGNNASSNRGDGIELYVSSKNTITGNNFSNNRDDGIDLHDSSNNNITGNNVRNNGGDGIFHRCCLGSSSNNTITGNNIRNNGGDGIFLDFSSKNTITGNNFSNNGCNGIFFKNPSNNNIITGNNVRNNGYNGICLCYSSNNNIITGNNFSNNERNGIYLSSKSYNNKIYLNNFLNNTDNFYSRNSSNIWNSPLKITYTYDTTTYESYLGNYWTDYKGKYPDAEEIDSTRIWDTPYIIDGDRDNYPLMEPWENYIDTSQGSTKILFSDDFSDDGSGWDTYDRYDGRVIYKDGCLYVKDYTNPKATIYGESQRYFTDFILEVETRLVGGTIDNWHTVCCRFKDEDNAYTFGISADGYYEIGKEVNDKVEALAGPTYSAYIHQGQDVTNLIHVECIGSSLSLSVNGHLLRKVTDATFTGGDIALGANSLAGTFTEVAFDNLVVTKP